MIKLDGVSPKVNIEKKIAVVSYNRNIEDLELTECIEKAGYQVIKID